MCFLSMVLITAMIMQEIEAPIGVPSASNRITGKIAGVTTRSNVDIGFVTLNIIKRMRHGYTFG